jgi:serine/threonine-protein kinase
LFADKYLLTEVLGRGGMGVVLGGEHVQLQQPVAIKFLLPHIAAIPGTLDRFLREARAAARIQGEHAVRILDVGSTAGVAYMIMERLSGVDLEALSVQRGPLPVDETAGYLLEACAAVAEAHASGIVHRDLKPANLFLARRPDGTATLKVLDFGISKSLADGVSALTAPNAPMGSPPYMSPEQVTDSRSVDARSDVWSLGVILFELLTRTQPFVGSSVPHLFTQILMAEPRRPRELRPDLPPEIEEIILACLVRDPTARIPDAAELSRRLKPFALYAGARSIPPPISSTVRVGLMSQRTEMAATLSPSRVPGATAGRARKPRGAALAVAVAALVGLAIARAVSAPGGAAKIPPSVAAPATGEEAIGPGGPPVARPAPESASAPGGDQPLVQPASPASAPTMPSASAPPATEVQPPSLRGRHGPRKPAEAPPPAPSASVRVRDLTGIKPIE